MTKFLSVFLFFLPVAFLAAANQQFGLVKFSLMLFCSAFVLLYLAKHLWKGTLRPLPLKGVFLPGILFLLYLAAQSLFLSEIPIFSIWGSYQRHTGLITWFCLGILMWGVYQKEWSEKEIRKVLTAMAISGAVVGMIAILQVSFPTLWGGLDATSGRAFSTLGVPNFLGQWTLLLLPVTYYLSQSAERTGERYGWVLAGLLQCAALFLSQNRTSLFILGLVLLGYVFLLLWRMRSSWQKAAFVSTFLVLLVSFSYAIVQRPDGLRSLATREALYPMAVSAIVDNPLFGYGLDTLYTVFSPRVPENLSDTESVHDVPDKVHQVLLDTLAETGLVGLFLLIWMFLSIAALGIVLVRSEDREVRQRSFALLLGLAMWTLALFVSFPGITERVFVAIFIGFLTLALQVPKKLFFATLFERAGAVTTVVLACVLFVVSIGTIAADVTFAGLMHSTKEQQLQQLVTWTPIHTEYKIFGSNGRIPSVSNGLREQLLTEALNVNPQDVWAWVFLADVRFQQQDYTASQRALQQALEACSQCAFVALQGARISSLQGDIRDAQNWAEIYIKMMPEFIFADPRTLSVAQKERQRILWKEQKTDLDFIRGLLSDEPTIPKG